MATRTFLAACTAIGLMVPCALGQFAPPGGGGGDISLTPPTNTSQNLQRGPFTAAFVPNRTFTVNAMIGYVNDQPIFVNDIFRPIDTQLRKLASDPTEDFKRVAEPVIRNQLSLLVSDIIVVSAAEGMLSEDDRKRIEIFLALELNRIKTENGGSEPAAEAALAKTGSSIGRELADRRRGFVRSLYFQRYLAPRIQITRDMALTAYERDLKRWQEPAKLELYTLTMPVSRWLREPATNGELGAVKQNPTPAEVAAAEAQAMAMAREIVSKLKAGANFAEMVEQYSFDDGAKSKGGRWGLINVDSLSSPQLKAFVLKLPANTLGDPVFIRDGKEPTVVIAKLGTKADARTVPFEEAQSKIMKEIQDQMIRDLQEAEMRKLEKKSTMEAVERMGGVALDAAVTRYATR